MSRTMLGLALLAVAGASAFCTAKIMAGARGTRLARFTLRQTEVVQGPTGAATTSERLFVQREDGTRAQSETFTTASAGQCETGATLTGSATVTWNTCTKLKSTFPGGGAVRPAQATCAKAFAGARLLRTGRMFGVRTEELLAENAEEKGLYVVSPDLACGALSEVHQWKANGVMTGDVTLLTATSLTPEADSRLFEVAGGFREVKPSEERNLFAALTGASVTSPSYQKANQRMDARYARANHLTP